MPRAQLAREKNIKSLLGVVISGRFRIVECVGGGSFGDVFMGVNIYSGTRVAVKVEPSKRHGQVLTEYRTYRTLNECALAVGIPQVYFGGKVGDYNVVVMDLLGPNLEQVFNLCGRKFGVKTVCMIGIQIFQRMQSMHCMNYIHRDIKPENFVLGVRENSQIVYVIDLGLAKRYRDPRTLQHIPWESNKSLAGTVRYMSINTHRGIAQTRRDDLESVMYLLFYFLRGGLPWQGMKHQANDHNYEGICDMKVHITPHTLAEGYPRQFATLLEYTRSLRFEETPSYSFCLQLLNDVLAARGETFDYQYSWLENLGLRLTEEANDEETVEDEPPPAPASSTARSKHRSASTNATHYQGTSYKGYEEDT
ncbi:casein kinase 1 isoform 2 [Trypanosoma conorhini]|uniref:non-specific serine/threonine protein kinase n=1 Tax=Trypanosoma conorhini TaxID=83891 RepID=A0A3R7MJE4_9TRYP|nr:casein kinase 1 isoform 2 [Trypanosoma conorhini]RNF06976.1 casein kinase 1 isoform 2 [Trypanosoma conorhini]